MRAKGISFLVNLAAIVFGGLSAVSIAVAQETLQFNVPYHCPDGTDNIITKCQTNARGGQVCFWREEKNGQLIVERFNVRGQMDGWLKICKVQTPPPAKAAAAPQWQPGQPMNPPYLSDFPAVEKVKREIQGSAPDDTLARQVAVFTYLPQIVIRSQPPTRSVRAGLTPDEQLVTSAYNLAAYEISQAYAKSHTLEEAKTFERKHGQYEMDSDFYNDWFNRLFSAGFRARYGQAQSANAAHAKAHFDAERQTSENAKSQQAPAGSANPSQIQPGSKQELARCIASGRSQRVCFSEVLGNGMDQLTGISTKSPSTPGLRMTGDYSSANGFRIIFQPEKAVMSCRGVPSSQPYLVEVSETQALVKIQNGAKPVVLALKQDGKLDASGAIKLTGQVPAGTRTEQTMGATTKTTTTQTELTPLEAQQYPDAKQNGQIFTNTETSAQTSYGSTGIRQVTQYVNKTVDCTVAPLTPTGPTPLPPDIESPFGQLTAIFSGTSVLMQGGNIKQATAEMLNTDKAPAPGLRMSGKYAGPGDFSVTFHPDSAVVACGDAEFAHEYFIQKNANQILLRIKDAANPITLQLKPDGSLFSEATVQVNGRVIVSATEDPKNPFVYAPKIGRCAIGTLVAVSH